MKPNIFICGPISMLLISIFIFIPSCSSENAGKNDSAQKREILKSKIEKMYAAAPGNYSDFQGKIVDNLGEFAEDTSEDPMESMRKLIENTKKIQDSILVFNRKCVSAIQNDLELNTFFTAFLKKQDLDIKLEELNFFSPIIRMTISQETGAAIN